MQSRIVVPLVCAAAIVFACGPRFRAASPAAARARLAHASERPSSPAAAQASVRRRKGDTTAVDAALAVDTAKGRVQIALDIVNVTRRRLEIDFPDGQTRDVTIFDERGVEVWRWSTGRLFTQTVQNRFLASGDTARYEFRWRAPHPGRYSVVAVLRSRNYPVERTTSFVVASSGVRVVASVDSTR